MWLIRVEPRLKAIAESAIRLDTKLEAVVSFGHFHNDLGCTWVTWALIIFISRSNMRNRGIMDYSPVDSWPQHICFDQSWNPRRALNWKRIYLLQHNAVLCRNWSILHGVKKQGQSWGKVISRSQLSCLCTVFLLDKLAVCHCVPVVSDSSICCCCVHRPPTSMLSG